MSVSFGITHDLDATIKLLSQSNQDRATRETAQVIIDDMKPYVPELGGRLVGSARIIGNDTIEYGGGTAYGRAQFYGTNGLVVFRQYTKAGSGSRWDLKAEGNHGKEWAETYAKKLLGG